MTDPQSHALAVLRDVDARLHRLFEAVENADETAATPAPGPLGVLRRARSQIDAALFAQHCRADDESLRGDGSCILQWTPRRTPPQQLVLEPDSDGDSWTRRELEWTGAGWRTCRRDTIRDVAISAPAGPRYPAPVDPPTLDALLALIRGTWTHPDPDVLVFDTAGTTEQGVLVAVEDELRYRAADSHQWYTITNEAELSHHLQQQGQPVVQSLSETSLRRQHFTPSPLTNDRE
ncbi:hypothetical protein PNP59_13545 [Halobacterium salinarum]|uniref:hypothetical protein n=1 Tax=Halobacterium salinarum TaxID=2242 RepID=UPI002554B171|nr:hypothetical protein [Halobacterium salinarum]MDL0131935.1 hypothetical protein [Halobacterium salinarum]